MDDETHARTGFQQSAGDDQRPTGTTPWTPNLNGQHPEFGPGNAVATRHGIYSPRKVDPLATSLVEGLLADDDVAYLRGASYRPACWAWARAEATVQLLVEHIETIGGLVEALNERGSEKSEETHSGGHTHRVSQSVRTASALAALDRAERHAQTCRSRLGLDPVSRFRMGKDVAAATLDMATFLSAERERLEGGVGAANSEQGSGTHLEQDGAA